MVQKSRSQKLNGLTSLAYLGVMPSTPSNFTIQQRAPTAADWRNHYIGDIWLDNSSTYPPPGTTPVAANLWILVSLSANSASWINFGSGGAGGGAINFFTDAGTAIVLANDITIHGGSNINTSGAASTVTVNLNNTVSISGSFTTATTATIGTGLFVTAGGLTVTAGGATITGIVKLPTVYGAVVGAGSMFVIMDATGQLGTTATGTGGGPGGVTSWVDVPVAAFTMAVNTGYTADFATTCTLTLPAAAAYGSVIRVCGKGAGGWSIAQNAGQLIHAGFNTSTTGATGSVLSSYQFDTIELLCSVANTTWTALSMQGNLVVV